MPMTWYLALVSGIATLFYAAFPAIGAFLVRGQWRSFRKTVTAVSHFPTASPTAIGRERTGAIGYYRFFGSLEAIQGEDRIWITNGRFSVAADLRGVRVYLIPDSDGQGEDGKGAHGSGEAGLKSVPWSRIFSLPEGTPVFLAGAFFAEEGRGVFRDHGRVRLLVVIHDCPRESIVRKAIGSGRQRNEYINAFTLPSVAIGALLLILLAFSLLSAPESRLVALIALTAGLAPVSPFLPPGFPLYFAYRSYWKKARLMRAQRDVVRLPLRYFPPVDGQRARRAMLLPDMEPYVMIKGFRDEDNENAILSEGMRIDLPADIRRIDWELPSTRWTRQAGGVSRECVVFAAYREKGDEIVLQKPEDPMAEQVLVPGDPEAVSRASDRAAAAFTVISGLFIFVNVAVNLPLLFLLLSLVIR
jgi:hypothetical protein